MHDYIRGAFQALTWAREIVGNCEKSESMQKALFALDEALRDIEHGVAVDFRWRLRSR